MNTMANVPLSILDAIAAELDFTIKIDKSEDIDYPPLLCLDSKANKEKGYYLTTRGIDILISDLQKLKEQMK